MIAASDKLGDDDLAGRGKAHGQKVEQVKDVSSGGYSRHAAAADDLSDDDHVDDVIDGLQGVGNEEGGSEGEQQLCNIAVGQIAHHGFVLWLFCFLHFFLELQLIDDYL